MVRAFLHSLGRSLPVIAPRNAEGNTNLTRCEFPA